MSYARVARETTEYVLREMLHPEGGFYATQDADSEGEEGKFFVWTKPEVDALLGDASRLFCRYYDITPSGNWEHGNNILHLTVSEAQLAKMFTQELRWCRPAWRRHAKNCLPYGSTASNRSVMKRF